nr:MAG TPA: hypothetical protein [Caudoviricetes sp.]
MLPAVCWLEQMLETAIFLREKQAEPKRFLLHTSICRQLAWIPEVCIWTRQEKIWGTRHLEGMALR